MSFVNLMKSDRWSEADIVNRTEALIAAEFTPNDVAIINRIVTAAAAGMYQLTDVELAQVEHYNAVCLQAREAGAAARSDMALLTRVLDFEAAQQLIAAATEDVLELAALRAPPTVVEPPEGAVPNDPPVNGDEPSLAAP